MMHGRGPHDNTKEEENVLGNTEESLSTLGDGSYEAKRHAQADDNSNVASNTTTELGEAYDLPGSEKDHIVDAVAQEPNVDLSSGQHTNTQGAGDYTQLLNQYIMFLRSRGKRFCSSFSSLAVGITKVLVDSGCLVAPCSYGGTCVGKTCDATSGIGHNGKSPSFEDGDIIKTAMEAAERAISSLKTKTSEKGEESNEGQLEQSAICETDLTVVFNAWYSAGFHTGKSGLDL
ncbi:hypothetical protein Acr_20g0004960 [Actinidia rufa]|uniref:Uncharacterized protein n=1 Tax=Actinidia rufa TaxID=165716 RepID=A0A7J0GDC1_9ERIC|nr:hypothetical protein Acr_20g0004960 [Actinidia rufa]